MTSTLKELVAKLFAETPLHVDNRLMTMDEKAFILAQWSLNTDEFTSDLATKHNNYSMQSWSQTISMRGATLHMRVDRHWQEFHGWYASFECAEDYIRLCTKPL